MVSSNAFWKNIYTFDFCPKSICDAQGNQMATYTVLNEDPIIWQSSPIYGSSRVGVFKPNMELSVNSDANDVSHTCTWLQSQPQNYYEYEIYRGIRKYELSNHLGNVLVVISDKRSSVCVSGVIDHYEADVLQATDYYCFGSPMPGRAWVVSGVGDYRWGFNGKEKDNEINIDGGDYDFGARIYDSRLCRWLSVDPLCIEQPGLSPYKSFLNNPLYFSDKSGEIEKIQTITTNYKGETIVTISYKNRVMTDGKIHKVTRNSGSYYFINKYYNYTTTTFKYVDENGDEHIVSSTSKIFDTKSVQSEIVWDWWNISEGTAGDPKGETARDRKNTMVNGGIAFYSSNGQSQESKTTKGVVNMVDIDPILDAINAFGPGGGLQKKLDGVFKQIKLGKDAEAVKVALGIMSEIMEFYGEAFDKGYSIKEAMEKVKRKSTSETTDSTKCQHCGTKIDKNTLKDKNSDKHAEQNDD